MIDIFLVGATWDLFFLMSDFCCVPFASLSLFKTCHITVGRRVVASLRWATNINRPKFLSSMSFQSHGRCVVSAEQQHKMITRSTTSSSNSFLSAGSVACLAVLVVTLNHENDVHYTMNHCQVPCGIFDDPAMINELKQSCLTIRKAIVQSNSLHGQYVDTTPLNANQFIRWVMTKEDHADKIISTMSDYCLCQRVKRANFSTELEYLNALKLHHVVMQAAMKTKQSMDLVACEELELAIDDLAKMYTPVVSTQV
jgi:Nickel-containing superoxide dismutase